MKYGIGRFTEQKQDHYTADFDKVFRRIERKTGIKTMPPKTQYHRNPRKWGTNRVDLQNRLLSK